MSPSRCRRCGADVEEWRWTGERDHLVPVEGDLMTDLTRSDGSWPDGSQETARCSEVYDYSWLDAK